LTAPLNSTPTSNQLLSPFRSKLFVILIKITINLKQGSINLKVHGAKLVREKVNLAGVKFWNYSSSILTF
jgi:hypothetical protein